MTPAGLLHNKPGTSFASHSVGRLRDGSFGDAAATPALADFFLRDEDNLNSSYDAGDQVEGAVSTFVGWPP